ncbi:MAG TPA: zinc finger domain-containing protein [archaeon]|nr:zinc finger domain-containing protein [archaeon]
MQLKCSTCGTDVLAKDNFVEMKCPSCGNETIVRCSTCKFLSNKYICSSCKFTGP